MKPKEDESPQKKIAAQKIKILVVDQHPVVRQGLSSLIRAERDLTVIAETGNLREVFDIIRNRNPDMGIVNILIGEKCSLELVKNIKTLFPKFPVLAFSAHDETLFAERVIMAGAKGYIMKNERPENLIFAIRKVADRQIYASERVEAKLMKRLTGTGDGSPIDKLTDRELEIFILIGEGYGVRQIAEKLYLSTKTIETYKAKLKEKLHLNNGINLRRQAILWQNKRK